MSKTKLCAGAYRQLLTPQKDTYLGGYVDQDGDINLCRVPDDVLGDVYARALVLDDGKTRVCFLDVDAAILNEGEIYPEGMRQRLAKGAGVDAQHFYLFTTHNHQSFKYLSEREIGLLERAVAGAVENLKPCTYGLAEYTSDIGVNRRPRYVVAEHLPYDNRLLILKLAAADTGEPIAVIFNYPVHNTAFGTARPDNWHYMTSELTGFAALKTEEFYMKRGVPLTAFHFNGFYGAAGPNFDGHFTAEHAVIKSRGEAFGKEIAELALSIKADNQGEITAQSLSEEYVLREECGGGKGVVTYYGVRLGELAIFGADCEPFADLGAKVRAYSPFDKTLLLANINGFSGYIPTEKTFLSPLNEAETQVNKTPYTRKAEEQFLAGSLKLLCNLKGLSGVRVTSAERLGRFECDGGVRHSFAVPEMPRICKVVVDFGEESRFDCAQDFDIVISGNAGEREIAVRGNSVNIIGVPVGEGDVTAVDVIVKKSYREKKDIRDIMFDLKVTGECFA